MKRLNSDIQSTASSMFNYSRTFGPGVSENLGGYKQLIMTHSNGQPTGAPGPLNPAKFNDGSMANPVSAQDHTNPPIITPSRVYASFSLPDMPNVVFPPPRQYAYSFYLKALPVTRKMPMRQSATQKAFNGQSQDSSGGRMPLFSLDPFYKNALSAILQYKAARENYAAYSEIADDMLYNGLWRPESMDAPNEYTELLSKLSIFKQFHGWCAMDGVTMVNETYSGREPMQASLGNTIFNELKPVVESYHEMTQKMKGIYKMFNYWGRAAMDPGADLYMVERKFKDEEYRDGIKDGVLNFSLGRSNGQGYVETFECPINVQLKERGFRFKQYDNDDYEGVDHIRPRLFAPVAIAGGGPLPRKYLREEDEEGRKRYGHHVYIGRLMKASPFGKDATRQLRPDELRPLMDSRTVNNKEVIDVLVNPDDCLHTLV